MRFARSEGEGVIWLWAEMWEPTRAETTFSWEQGALGTCDGCGKWGNCQHCGRPIGSLSSLRQGLLAGSVRSKLSLICSRQRLVVNICSDRPLNVKFLWKGGFILPSLPGKIHVLASNLHELRITKILVCEVSRKLYLKQSSLFDTDNTIPVPPKKNHLCTERCA